MGMPFTLRHLPDQRTRTLRASPQGLEHCVPQIYNWADFLVLYLSVEYWPWPKNFFPLKEAATSRII